MNAIKDSIKSGRTVVGTTVTPNVDVSILADAGYDFLLFDPQHSAWEIKQLQPSIQTMRGKQAAHRLDRRLQLLDLPGGVLGIEQQEVVPGVGQNRHVNVRCHGSPDDGST